MPIHQKMRITMLRHKQGGVSLIFALIVLVLMAISGLALLRSMDTSNLIAGNMAFQQSAVHSSDAGVEAAISWLTINNAVAGVLYSDSPAAGYTASAAAVPANVTGEDFWNSLSAAGICFLPVAGGACTASPGVPDPAGNTVSYMIQRLCGSAGATTGNSCSTFTSTSGITATGNNEGAGEDVITPLTAGSAVYYRITVRVTGPRNSVSYVQSIVSM